MKFPRELALILGVCAAVFLVSAVAARFNRQAVLDSMERRRRAGMNPGGGTVRTLLMR